MLGAIDGVYDRAALVALPLELRGRYLRHLKSLLGPSARLLMLTYVYNQQWVDGPPYAVADAEIKQVFEADFKLELLQLEEVAHTTSNPKFRGISSMQEKVFLITRD